MHALPVAMTNTCQHETASELAAAIVQMHRDEQANADCARAGLSYVADGYNVSRINGLIRDIAQPALKGHRVGTRPGSDQKVLEFGAKSHSTQLTLGAEPAKPSMRVVFR
jgi:hypothetical protein